MVEISTGALIYAMFVLILIFLLYEKGKKKYQPFCDLLDKEEYRLKELMTIGFSLMDMIRYSYASNFDRKLRKQIKELKEEDIFVKMMLTYLLHQNKLKKNLKML